MPRPTPDTLPSAAFRSDLIVDVDGTAKQFGTSWMAGSATTSQPSTRVNACTAGPQAMHVCGRTWNVAAVTQRQPTWPCWQCGPWLSVPTIAGLRVMRADKDQAGLLRDAMATLVRLNPWLASILDVQAHSVVNVAKGDPGEGGTLRSKPATWGSYFVILPDLIIGEKLCHWQGEGSLWHSLISSAAEAVQLLVGRNQQCGL